MYGVELGYNKKVLIMITLTKNFILELNDHVLNIYLELTSWF